jgi:hypothetical protein
MEAAVKTLVTVPQHVVFRSFVAETVLLNIQTGQYHGLNPVAGRMLELLAQVGSVDDVVEPLAREFDVPVERVDVDLRELVEGLRERGLVEVRTVGDG